LNSYFDKHISFICFHCGMEATVEYRTVFEKWTRKLKYCPYCGHDLKEPSNESIFEKETEGEDT
jgi:hypothetical protein